MKTNKPESKHTPGPWGYVYDGSSDWSIGPMPDPQANSVAHIWDRNDERAVANVRLVAAAPDGYKLAEMVLTCWEEHRFDTVSVGDCEYDNYFDGEPDFVTQAKLFLQKVAEAEGKF